MRISTADQWGSGAAADSGSIVHWLGKLEPPAQLVAHLRTRGLGLTQVSEDAASAPGSARLLLVEPTVLAGVRTPSIKGRRVAVLHPDPSSADGLAQALRSRGAEVILLGLNPDVLRRFESFDPDAIVMAATDFYGSCWEMARAVLTHPRVKYGALLLVTMEHDADYMMGMPDLPSLCVAIQQVSAATEALSAQALTQNELSFSLERFGPAKALRLLTESGRAFRARFACAPVSIEVDIAEGIIVGAQSAASSAGVDARQQNSDVHLGVHALALLLAQERGQVEVRVVDRPAVTNVMSLLEAALHMAREAGPVANPRAPARSPAEEKPVATRRPTHRDGSVAPAEAPPANSSPPAEPALARPAPNAVEARGSAREQNIEARGVAREQKIEPLAPPAPPAPPAQASAATSVLAPVCATLAAGVAIGEGDVGVVGPPEPFEPVRQSVLGPGPRPFRSNRAPKSGSMQPPAPGLRSDRAPKSGSVQLPPDSTSDSFARRIAELRAAAARPAITDLPVAPYVPRSIPPSAAAASQAPRSGSHAITPAAADSRSVAGSLGLGTQPGASRPWRRLRVLLAGGALLVLVLGATAVAWDRGDRASEKAQTSRPPVASAPAEPPQPAEDTVLPAAPEPTVPPEAVAAPEPAAPSAEVGEGVDELTMSEFEASRLAEPKPNDHAGRLAAAAYELAKSGELGEAKARYLEALRASSTCVPALVGLAVIALAQGNGKEAIDYAIQVRKLRPGQTGYLLVLAAAYAQAGQANEARMVWEAAAKQGSQAARARLERAP